MQIRKATREDYKQIAKLRNIIVPDLHETAEKLVENDKIRDKKIKFCRWVTEVDSNIVAEGFYSHLIDYYHPNKFEIDIVVLPEYQHQGIGTALYNSLTKELAQFKPIRYHASSKDNSISGISFLNKLGFSEIHRERIAHLEVQTINLTAHTELMRRLLKEGIIFKKLHELKNDYNYEHRLYELEWELVSDIPSLNEPLVKQTFEEWHKNSLNHPEILHDAFHVAVKEKEYIGYSYLWGGSDKKIIHNGMTGVIKKYRGQGIAMILKMLGVKFAQENNYQTLLTSNATINKPVLAINEKLGYKKQYEIVEMIKKL